MAIILLMSAYALGLIETAGLIGAIVATDAAAKAAAVKVSSAELTDATFMTIRIEGELGAVQAAVEAGAEAAQKVSELLVAHVIPNPDDGLGAIMLPKRYISKYHPDDDRPSLLPETVAPPPPRPRAGGTGGTKRRPRAEHGADRTSTASGQRPDLEKMTVAQLRVYARSLPELGLKGRQISQANKKQLIDAIKSVLNGE